jgi:putative Mg2+ transporter-C (MgtC) family protein
VNIRRKKRHSVIIKRCINQIIYNTVLEKAKKITVLLKFIHSLHVLLTGKKRSVFMDTILGVETLAGLLLAVVLGGLVGWEREKSNRPAGLRTHMLVCLGSCLFTLVSINFSSDPARIAAGIVAGIGFIGAGTIWGQKDKIQGITTAASLWTTAAIGLAVGIEDYPLAIVVAVIVFTILIIRQPLKKAGLKE